MDSNSIEKLPGASPEISAERELPPEQDFAKNFESGVPPFAGENFGTAHEGNDYYGESVDNSESEADEPESDYNEGVASAASLINYGLDGVAREKGVEAVVQGIKSFDATGSENPLRDLYDHLGIDTKEGFKDVREESMASKAQRMRFRDEYNMPKTEKRSREGMLKAIADMKELIAEVESADPRYEELRTAAKAYGKGYFEYAVKNYGLRGLTELFSVLADQKEKKEKQEEESKESEQTELEQPKQEEQKEETEQSEQPEFDQALDMNSRPER